MIAAGTVYCYLCWKPAFVAKENIHSGDVVSSMQVEHVDGTEIFNGEVVRCDSCGATLDLHPLYQHNMK